MSGMRQSPSKQALVIGINKYPQLAARYQLQGCVHDAELMSSILSDNFGFPQANIALLKDEQATRKAILTAMDALIERTGENDIVVIHYSGHGSRRRDKEGDEPDGWDETIVPCDSGRGYGENRDITDDEVYARLLQLSRKTPYTALIFDCCHSGTITRDPFGPGARWVPPDQTPAEELPDPDIPSEMLGELCRDVGPSGWMPISDRYTLIAGCDDDESSWEHTVVQGGQVVSHGALTFFLCQQLVRAGPGATYRDVFERASAQVTAAHPQQHPQAEGARDREVFGVHDVEPLRFVPVTEREGGQLMLAAGAAHGITVGSQWAIYPQGAKGIKEGIPRLGTVEVAAVRAVQSYARILAEKDPGAIAEGCRAVEEAHFYGEMRLVVDIYPASDDHTGSVEDLKDRVWESELLCLREGAEPADAAAVRVYLIAPRAEACEGDPVPQLTELTEATWAVVQDGQLIMPPHGVREPSVTALLCENLEKLARYRNVLALKNPDPDCRLRGKVRFTLKREKDGTWIDVGLDETSIFQQGDAIDLKIANDYDQPIYVSVLDLGLTGRISLLYPPNRPSERFEPMGTPVLIGQRAGGKMTLSIPVDFHGDAGIETFKLFATTHPADFSWLQQEGVRTTGAQRATAGFGTPLQQLFETAYTGAGTRDCVSTSTPPEEEWIAIERTFTLRRRL